MTNCGANCLLEVFSCQLKQWMSGILFILEYSLVSFFPDIPYNEAWRQGPSQAEEFIVQKVSSPIIEGIDDTPIVPIDLLKNGSE